MKPTIDLWNVLKLALVVRSSHSATARDLTVWPVDDMSTSEALRQAQLAMANQGLHLYYWAAFVLYGDGGKLGSSSTEGLVGQGSQKSRHCGLSVGGGPALSIGPVQQDFAPSERSFANFARSSVEPD